MERVSWVHNWFEEIKNTFIKNKLVKGEDKLGQAILVLSNLTENIEMIKEILEKR